MDQRETLEQAVYLRFLHNITVSEQNPSVDTERSAPRLTVYQEKLIPGTLIPQRPYCQGNPIPYGAAGKSIMFAMADGGCIPAELALTGQCDSLVDKNSTVFADHTQTINMRIEVPGLFCHPQNCRSS